jgi:RND family efflux transporter MFP subunit
VVRVQVSELDVVQLAQGQAATVVLDAFPGQRFAGRIRRIFPGADPATRLVPVEVALDAESARSARPGFLARVSFALEPRDGVRLVPASAVVGGGASQAVLVGIDGRANRRMVQTGVSAAGNVEIVSGVEEGEVVVIAGVNTLRDGMAVREVPEGSSRAAAPAEPVSVAPAASGGG